MIGRLSDEAIAASVAPALRAINDELGSTWSRQVVAQLVAVAEYGGARDDDPSPGRLAELDVALDGLAGNPLVPSNGSPHERAAAALAAAVDDDGADAAAVRDTLRPLLVGELDAELTETSTMLDGFRGRLRGS